jgi:dipeptidyl aminopeptidase/acylaminoacyl peptidase
MSTPIGKRINHHPDDYPFLDSAEIQFLDFISNGVNLTGFIAKPKKNGEFPIIIYNRGGNQEVGGLLVGTAVEYMAPIAAEGYVVLAIDYQGINGGVENEEFGGSDVGHLLNLIKSAKTLPFCDSSKIGLVGISRGGMMNYLIQKLSGDSIQIDASVNISAISDLEFSIQHHPQLEDVCNDLIPNYTSNRDSELNARSVIKWPQLLSDQTAQLIMCGTADQHVHHQQAISLADSLKAHQKPHKLVVYDGANHGLVEKRAEVMDEIMGWLEKYVANDNEFR